MKTKEEMPTWHEAAGHEGGDGGRRALMLAILLAVPLDDPALVMALAMGLYGGC